MTLGALIAILCAFAIPSGGSGSWLGVGIGAAIVGVTLAVFKFNPPL